MLRLSGRALIVLLLMTSSTWAQDMALSGVLIDGEGWELVAEGFDFTEGPAADEHGNLFFTDIPKNRIHKLDAQGKLSVFVEQSHATNGLMFGANDRLYGCQQGMRRIVVFDSSGATTTIADDVDCNDLVVHRNGGVYFTDPGNKRVWYVNPQGEKRIVDEGIGNPNGIILWPDQGTLVVADTTGENLWAFRIEQDGSLAFKQPYYTMRLANAQTGSGADGMTVDTAGRLYVATHAGIQMFDPTGRLGGVILKPQPAFISNVAFGGEKLDTLYVTASDKLYRRKTKATGLFYFR